MSGGYLGKDHSIHFASWCTSISLANYHTYVDSEYFETNGKGVPQKIESARLDRRESFSIAKEECSNSEMERQTGDLYDFDASQWCI